MSNNTDLTIMALALAFLALMVIVVLLVLASLLVRVKSFEKMVEKYLGESRMAVQQIEQSGQRVSALLDDVHRSRGASVLGAIRAGTSALSPNQKGRWWIAAASLAWTFWRRRHHKAGSSTALKA